MSLGNITPSAEFNIYVDPHAANIVLKSGLPLVMMGLDVTHKVNVNDNIIERIKSDLHPGQLAFENDQDTQIIGLSAGYGAGKTRRLCAKAVQ